MTENPNPGNVNKMKAIAINRFGDVDELELKKLPIPQIEPDEVLIRVHAAGVGPWDPKEREGVFAKMRGDENPDFPRILGREASGTVLGVGAEVTKFKEGDKVYVNGSPSPAANLYAEYATAKAKHVMPIPDNLSMFES
ncbi:MAG: alcohol dehydrogenase catalytic domain-containing protein, partial [Balneolaceae bacterium]|nr:alcohol dehydrogenase catalytic domain-containing protein [Balneolaceae bacterium]